MDAFQDGDVLSTKLRIEMKEIFYYINHLLHL